MSTIEDEIRRQMLDERARSAHLPVAVIPPPPLPPVPAASPTAPGAHADGSAQRRKGILGGLGAIGVLIAKFWSVIITVLFKLKILLLASKLAFLTKILLTGGSMLVSMALYAWMFGWMFGVVFVLSIF